MTSTRLLALGALASLSACTTTVADLQERTPFIETTTAKSVQAYSACLAQQWAARSGTVNTTPREKGVAMTLSYLTIGSAIIAATVNIDDLGASRAVTVYARKGDGKDKLGREINACL